MHEDKHIPLPSFVASRVTDLCEFLQQQGLSFHIFIDLRPYAETPAQRARNSPTHHEEYIRGDCDNVGLHALSRLSSMQNNRFTMRSQDVPDSPRPPLPKEP